MNAKTLHCHEAQSTCPDDDLAFCASIDMLSKASPTPDIECLVGCLFCSKKFVTNNSVDMKIADRNGFVILLFHF
jgi:hypothetical protein